MFTKLIKKMKDQRQEIRDAIDALHDRGVGAERKPRGALRLSCLTRIASVFAHSRDYCHPCHAVVLTVAIVAVSVPPRRKKADAVLAASKAKKALASRTCFRGRMITLERLRPPVTAV